ncbi:hypothetical protein BVX98_07490 [bacterium F11]|nr:hypothetical protein BVX98_07490 [bacterium F11]
MNKNFKDLVPKKWGLDKKNVPIRRDERDPFQALQSEMNRVFDTFSRGFSDWSPLSMEGLADDAWGKFSPSVDVKETNKEIEISAELPGMDEKDIQVTLNDDALVISGEKKSEQEEKGKEFYRMERSYGSFHRSIPLPEGVEAGKVEATFKKGVLHVKIPKRAESSRSVKKIPIQRN